MGLDQYLYASRYLHRSEINIDDTDELSKRMKVGNEQANKVLQAIGLTDLQLTSGGVWVKVEVGYWRKANHIHAWFVEKVQDGKDDCGEYYVTKEQLGELRDVCNLMTTASKEKLPELGAKYLPTKAGFFFGTTDYGDYYMGDLVRTVKLIDDVLHNPQLKEFEFYYSSSW